MNTDFRRFKMLDLRTMACDALIGDVNDATSFLKVFDDVLHAFGDCTTKISIV